MDVRFVVIAPASVKRSVTVRLPILVGRSDEARFRLRQDSVSRRHCEFFIEDDAVHVRDLGSTNGTFLDGAEIAADTATVVPPGAVVQVGGMAFRVDYESAARGSTDDDTVPLAAVEEAEAAEAEAAEEAEAEEAEESGEAAGAGTDFAAIDPAEQPSADGLEWPTDEAAAPPAADEKLDDFFRSLS
jgi:predicted component of type VI protein secretion system